MKKILLAVVMILMLASPAIADAPVNVIVNGKVLNTPGLIINDRTYVPLRAVSEGLGAQVDWDGSQAIVTSVKEPNISGDSVSVNEVKQALALLKEKDPADYEVVCRYTQNILVSSIALSSQLGEAYAITAGRDNYILSYKLLQKNDIEYLASTLVHESLHLCSDNYNIVNIRESENISYLRQISVLRILGASQKDIDDTERTRLRAMQ